MARWVLLLWIYLYPILCRKERSLPLVSALDNIPQPSPLDQRHYSTQRCLSRRKIFIKKLLITDKLTEVIICITAVVKLFLFSSFFPHIGRQCRRRAFFFKSAGGPQLYPQLRSCGGMQPCQRDRRVRLW